MQFDEQDLITLPEAAKLVPGQRHPTTIWRWANVGNVTDHAAATLFFNSKPSDFPAPVHRNITQKSYEKRFDSDNERIFIHPAVTVKTIVTLNDRFYSVGNNATSKFSFRFRMF